MRQCEKALFWHGGYAELIHSHQFAKSLNIEGASLLHVQLVVVGIGKLLKSHVTNVALRKTSRNRQNKFCPSARMELLLTHLLTHRLTKELPHIITTI